LGFEVRVRVEFRVVVGVRVAVGVGCGPGSPTSRAGSAVSSSSALYPGMASGGRSRGCSTAAKLSRLLLLGR